eukprot:4592806-Prymnesium_polylepis.1
MDAGLSGRQRSCSNNGLDADSRRSSIRERAPSWSKSHEPAMVDPEVKYAIMVQRAIRLRWHIYRQYGTELFCDAQGQTGQAGTIVFENTRAQWLKAAQFTSAMRLNLFLNHH